MEKVNKILSVVGLMTWIIVGWLYVGSFGFQRYAESQCMRYDFPTALVVDFKVYCSAVWKGSDVTFPLTYLLENVVVDSISDG